MTALPTDPAPPPRRAALHTLGCRLNQAETAAIRRSLEAEGYRIVPWGEEAEVCILNSCTVTAQSDAKARQALRAMRRRYPHARLALVGCYAQTQGDRLAGEGLADLILGNRDKMEVAAFLPRLDGAQEPLVSRPRIPREPFRLESFASLDGRTRAALKVQDGCDFMCTFCIIPTARGRARPRHRENLLEEAHVLAAGGAREVVLTGVNVGTYGDRHGGLEEIVDRLHDLPGLARIRISSIEPTTVAAGLLERMADPAHKLVPFLHLPLQSGSDRMLAAMRRRYTAGDYRRFAEGALQAVPGLCLGTDVLVGFPGEDDAAFEETHALLTALPFAYCHVFPFSERAGTPAVRLPDKVAPPTRARRAAVLNALSAARREAFHARFAGTTRDVLFEQPSAEGMAQGLTDNYIRVEVPASEAAALRNRILPVRLEAPQGATMRGALADPTPARQRAAAEAVPLPR